MNLDVVGTSMEFERYFSSLSEMERLESKIEEFTKVLDKYHGIVDASETTECTDPQMALKSIRELTMAFQRMTSFLQLIERKMKEMVQR